MSSAQTPLRVLAVGAGYFSQYHYQAWHNVTGAQCVGIVDHDIDKARDVAARWGIAQVYQSIEPALAALSDQPNKPNDHHLTVWAYEVALVLRDVLEVRPASTRVSNPLVTGTRGGAAYGRLLAASLPLVVVQHVDVDRLIAAGLKLLKDPAGDVYPPHVLVLGPTPKSDG